MLHRAYITIYIYMIKMRPLEIKWYEKKFDALYEK